MLISKATPEDIYDVALRMRESDFREFSALSWADTRQDLAEDLVARYASIEPICARHQDGEPVAIGDVVEVRPHVVSLLFFATDRFPEIAIPLTRFVVQRLFKQVKGAGVHRIEAVSMNGHGAAHRWIRTLGLRQEGAPFRKFGKGGEDYVQFAWVRDDNV